ncbi:hypothetical protein FPHYL_13434 [Fusarium phyllophilum]|uniref:Uncharacterized protein n=1 Tax=Fusarium phyllophilum TaxID=47803 RepID=A0A8H5IDM0_9HYPO|nr:hypothetical protein FPHYL_13434 [Fusarium phyllophilum]
MSLIFGRTRCDGCQALIDDTEPSAVVFYCLIYPTGDWRSTIAWRVRPNLEIFMHHARCTFLHVCCFLLILIKPDGVQRSQAELNCFGRAMGWRKLDLMHIFPKELDIPGPRRISRWAVAWVAQRLGRLPMELIDMVRSYCPDASFWNLVQLRDLQGFVSAGNRVIEKNLSGIARWERGYTLPVRGFRLKDPGCLLISLDSDGICEIQRFRRHPEPPNHNLVVKLRKYVLANEEDLESVNAYF